MRDKEDGEEDIEEEGGYNGEGGIETTVAENLVAPIKPLALLLPHRHQSTGIYQWKLFFLTISLLTTTSGVRLCFLRELRSVLKLESLCSRPSLSRLLLFSSSATNLTSTPKMLVLVRAISGTIR